MSKCKCKSCGAEIKWIKTFTGRMMPVDAWPILFQEGGTALFVTDKGAVIHGTKIADLNDIPINARTGYISHFATCPYADQHRRR